MEKAEISYPCDWSFTIIGSDKELIKKTVPDVMKNIKYHFAESRQSKNGKYASFNLSTSVKSEEERDRLFGLLKNIPTVEIVL